ncbi:gluconate 2-dehydrogenase subunit 3 family protein [Oceanobacillus saliphilus]|uniref:gluconate 2-dehydrogenase subunit 3 family protein n=1 Tax=Oceanobacillus saliphilus TaxID=2925834 RepID=UPI00201DCEB4|nr:gluconate 2-dehydrogenase subunit 3 family protein [Oceanobacillus saliphilus]
MSTNDQKSLDAIDSSRRKFLKNSGIAAGGIAVGGALGSLLGINGNGEPAAPASTTPTSNPTENHNQALMYFTPEQFAITDAATERIFPEDDNGPGAKELLIAYYIDHQLAGGWGTGATEYTSGPFFPGEPTQGYQGRLNRQQIFTIGLKGIQDYSQKTYQKNFPQLTAEEQDAVLTEFADGNVTLSGPTSSHFFSELRAATLEGAYADPLYGGNAGMAGWEMKNFPGHQMSYLNIIEEEFTEIKPQALNSQHNH